MVKALSITLGRFPGVNVSLEPGGAALLQHHSHNIGVAMATSNGLVVPNIKQVGVLGVCDVRDVRVSKGSEGCRWSRVPVASCRPCWHTH